MSVDLSAFQLTAQTKADRVEREKTEADYLASVGSHLYGMIDVADDHDRVAGKRERIVAKLDDPGIQATNEQRAAAEARASALFYEAQRHLKEFRKQALSFARLWTPLPDALQAWIRDEAFPLDHYDGIAAIAGNDQTVMGLSVWRSLVSGRAARKEQAS